MFGQHPSIAVGVVDDPDESNGTPATMSQGPSLQLSGSVLRLEVGDRALEFEKRQFVLGLHDHVGGPPICPFADRDLELDTASPVEAGPDLFGHPELAGIPQAQPSSRIQDEPDVTAHGRREPGAEVDVQAGEAALDPTHEALAHARQPRDAALRDAGREPRRPEIPSEPLTEDAGARSTDVERAIAKRLHHPSSLAATSPPRLTRQLPQVVTGRGRPPTRLFRLWLSALKSSAGARGRVCARCDYLA